MIFEHFESGELYEDYSWYSSIWNNNELVTVISKKRSYHDTFPFVWGELTHLFSEWQKADRGIIIYTPKPALDLDEGLRHFLGLTKKEAQHLFVPSYQSVKDLGGEELDVYASPKQVAKNIEVFLRRELDKLPKNN